MKKVILFLCFFFAIASIAIAQRPSHLKGPAAKNYKSWQDKDTQTGATLMVSTDRETLTGPAAKNSTVLQQLEETDLQVVKYRDLDLPMGPRYKNPHPWMRGEKETKDFVEELPNENKQKSTSSSGGN